MTFVAHPRRRQTADELHSRPTPEIKASSAVAHLAIWHEPEDTTFHEHVIELCRRYGAPEPHQERHYAADLGTFRFRYEQHTEFAAITIKRPLDQGEVPFARSGLSLLPDDWVTAFDGRVIAAAHLVLLDDADESVPPKQIESLLQGQRLLASQSRSGIARIFTAFREDGRGFTRYLLLCKPTQPERLGRLVQRIVEIDTYRMTALLASGEAKRIAPELTDLEGRLVHLVERLERERDLSGDTGLLDELFALASAVERLKAQTAFRFGASRAYARIVHDRISSLREERIPPFQRLGEFLERRFDPAMRTVYSIEERIERLALRIGRTADLARTRVDIALERQNRDLLASMEERARLQLRLQETVEGLSVVAVSYYALGLVAYVLAAALGWMLDDTALKIATGVAAPVVVLVVWLGLRRLKARAQRSE